MKILFTFFGLLLFSTIAFSQYNSISGRAGLCNLRGEFSEGISNNYGYDLAVVYSGLFDNSQWLYTAEITQSGAVLKNDYEEDTLFKTTLSQTYLGGGFRFCINPKIVRRPRPGELLPYFGFGVGLIYTNLTPENPGYTPPGYKTFEGGKVEVGMQFEGGLLFRLTREIAIEGYFASRTAGSDNWDGILGIGKGKDWLIRGGIGLNYSF